MNKRRMNYIIAKTRKRISLAHGSTTGNQYLSSVKNKRVFVPIKAPGLHQGILDIEPMLMVLVGDRLGTYFIPDLRTCRVEDSFFDIIDMSEYTIARKIDGRTVPYINGMCDLMSKVPGALQMYADSDIIMQSVSTRAVYSYVRKECATA